MYEANEIITLKLISGEEMVGRFVTETPDDFVLFKPLTLMPGQQGLALVQSIMSVLPDRDINIRKTAVVMHAPSRSEMSDAWIESTSGLKVGRKSMLME